MVKKITLTCESCGKTETFDGFMDAYNDGWDFPEVNIPVITCPKCPSAPLLIELFKNQDKLELGD